MARLSAHLSIPLYRNGYALMLSTATTSVLGVVYWILAARTYTTQAVGLNAAAIAAVIFLAGAAQLNLMSALLRFLPGAGRAAGRFVAFVYLISVTVAAAGSLSALGLDRRVPALGFLNASPVFSRWFTLATMAWCIFVLQDSVLTGLRRASWVLIENTAFALAKIMLLIVFAGALPRYGVFASWMIPVAATLVPVNLVIFRRLIPRHVRATQGGVAPLVPAQVVRYAAADYLGALCWLASTTLLPVLVASLAGPTATAYFFLCWQIAYALFLISPNMGSSLIVEAANDPSKLGIYSYRACVQTARLVVPLAVVIALGAPYVLRVFGDAYAAHGAMLLRLLALSAIPNIVTSLSVSIARARRHTGTLIAVPAVLCTLVLALSYLLVPVYGITGVGIAWAVSQAGIALIVLVTQLRPLWSTVAGARKAAPSAGR